MTRLVKIGIILVIVGSAMMFGSYVPICESNSMIQTLQTRLCDVFNVILLFATVIFSYVLIIAGAIMFLVNWINTKQRKQNLSKN